MAILGAYGYKKPTSNTSYSRSPNFSAKKYSPIPSRSLSSYGISPSRFKPGSSSTGLNIPSRPISNPVNFQGGFNPNANIYGGYSSPVQNNPFQPSETGIGESGAGIFSRIGSAFERWIQGILGNGSIQGTPGTAEQFFGDMPVSAYEQLSNDYKQRQYQGPALSDEQVIENASQKYLAGLETGKYGYGEGDPVSGMELWDKLISGNMDNPALQSGKVMGWDFRDWMPGGQMSGQDPFESLRDQGGDPAGG
ncbi:hypothetical protein CMI37_05305, partial [Candidatus Pacearchaeota archaeon]|nr:hypothetical protein [Candidatus Pacearchaeota archaeon]